MAINKKLITFEKLSTFQAANGNGIKVSTQTQTPDSDGNVGNIPYRSIVFIKDTGQIWTHGKYFNCSAQSLGLGSLAYKNSLSITDIPDLSSIYQFNIEIIDL